MDADEGPRPAEAVEEVGGHCLLGLFFFTRSLTQWGWLGVSFSFSPILRRGQCDGGGERRREEGDCVVVSFWKLSSQD